VLVFIAFFSRLFWDLDCLSKCSSWGR